MIRSLTHLFDHPRVLAIGLSVLTAAAVVGLTRVGFDDNYVNLFATSGEEYANYGELSDKFPISENDLLLVAEAPDVLSQDNLQRVHRVHTRLAKLVNVDDVFSLFSLRGKRRIGKYFLPVMRRDMDTAELEAAIPQLRRHPFGADFVTPESNATTLVIRLAGHDLSVPHIQSALSEIRQVIEDETAASEMTVGLTGLPALRVEIVNSVQRDQVRVIGVAVVLAGLMAWLMFRSWWAVITSCSAPIAGVVWTVGLMGWAGEDLNVLNMVVPTLLVVIGFTDSVHIMFQFAEERRSGHAPRSAAIRALLQVGPACMLTSATTAIGFGSLSLVDDELIRRFGVTCAAGTLLVMVAVLMCVPLLLATSRFGALGISSASPMSNRQRFSQRVIDAIMRAPKLIACAGALATVMLIWTAAQIEPDFRFSENLPAGNQANGHLRRYEELFGGSARADILVTVPTEAGLADPQTLQVLSRVHALLGGPEISVPTSLLTLLTTLPEATDSDGSPIGTTTLESLSARAAQLRYLPNELVSTFVNVDERTLRVTARVPDLGSAELLPHFQQIEQHLEQLAKDAPQYELRLTGLPVLSSYRSQQMIKDLALSLGTAAVAIFVLLAISLRSVRLGLVSIVPNLFPLAATCASLVLLDQPLRYSAVVCFSVCLGIAVDDTVHFLARYRRERTKRRNPRAALRKTFVAIAPVLVTTTVLMSIGFLSSLISEVPTIRLFGLTSCAALAWALVGDLLVLPAILTSAPDHTLPKRGSVAIEG